MKLLVIGLVVVAMIVIAVAAVAAKQVMLDRIDRRAREHHDRQDADPPMFTR